MSVIQKLIDAQDNQDLKAYNEVVSEDYVWVKHSTGEEIPREELSKWLNKSELELKIVYGQPDKIEFLEIGCAST